MGRANWLHVFQHGNPSLWEMVCRAAMVRMTLRTDGNTRHYYCSSAFKALDPTEKGAVSYFVGMIMCKLFAGKFLNVPWLMHLDVYRDQLNARLLSGRSRPDLIGQSENGEWVAFESKGRSSQPSQNDIRKAKMQAQRIISINDQPVRTNVALFSYYRNDRLQVYCEDPPSYSEGKEIQLEISPENLMMDYYLPLIKSVNSSDLQKQLETGEFTFIKQGDFSIGFKRGLLEYLLSENYKRAYEYLLENKEISNERDEEAYNLDGVSVKAGESWHKLFLK
ncbi:MAG: hypothetical protein WC962_00600 [Phycisphaerae bacterium]